MDILFVKKPDYFNQYNMPKVKFIIETGKVDSQGDVIDLKGMVIPDKKLLVLKDFDATNLLGRATVIKEDGVLKAESDLPESTLDLYPAIGFQIIKSEPNEHGGRNILEAKLYSVGLSTSPNVDPLIKRISDQ